MEEKTREVGLWLAKKGIPERENRDRTLHVIKKVQQELEDDEAGNLDGLFHTLSLDQQTFIQSCIPLNTMKKVRMLQNMDEFELKAICEQFKARKYTNGNIIIEAGKPFEMMVLIVDGLVKIEDCTCDLQLRGGDLYGQILIPWLSRKYSRGNLLLATKSLVAVGDVEALVLMATDLDSVLHKFTSHFRIYYYEVEDQLESHQTHVKALRLSTDEKGRRQAQ
ncbi:hypothetical protein ACFXTH_041227 [Malus domestica]